MNNLLSQVSYPVFLYLTFLFFLMGSVFSFFVGVALAVRSQKALRFFEFMNGWISVRRMMRPLSIPHQVEPALMRRRHLLGSIIIIGAAVSIYLLQDANLRPTLTLFDGSLTLPEMIGVADNLKGFLLVGNAICLLVGLMLIFFPSGLSNVEKYTDRLYSLRKNTRQLGEMHMAVDCWVLKHPTSAGITLCLLSLSAGLLMFNYMQSVTA